MPTKHLNNVDSFSLNSYSPATLTPGLHPKWRSDDFPGREHHDIMATTLIEPNVSKVCF